MFEDFKKFLKRSLKSLQHKIHKLHNVNEIHHKIYNAILISQHVKEHKVIMFEKFDEIRSKFQGFMAYNKDFILH
jgi:uncharacterized coiled-coil DUF342 family protein